MCFFLEPQTSTSSSFLPTDQSPGSNPRIEPEREKTPSKPITGASGPSTSSLSLLPSPRGNAAAALMPLRRQSSLPKFPVANHARMQAFATTSPSTYTSSSFARSSSVSEEAGAGPGTPPPGTSSSGLGAIPKNRDKQMETRKKQLETLKVNNEGVIDHA